MRVRTPLGVERLMLVVDLVAPVMSLGVADARVATCIVLSVEFVDARVVGGGLGRRGVGERAAWVVAFVFGLLHGLGFAGALREVGLPQGAIPVALLFFNVGVELGQILFVAVCLGVIGVIRRVPALLPSWSWRIAPYAIGGVAMFWVIQRTSGFVG